VNGRGPKLPRLSECRACHAPIRFVQLDTSGKALPVDPQPNPRGNVAAHLAGGTRGLALLGFVISRDRLPGARDPFRFVPHYATCEALTKPAKPAPAPDAPLF
jgi:hypothetical protein